MDIFGAIQPTFEGCRKVSLSARCRISIRPTIGGGRDVERDAQVAVLGANLRQRDDASKAGSIRELFVGVDDVLNVVVGKSGAAAVNLRHAQKVSVGLDHGGELVGGNQCGLDAGKK